MKIAIPSRSLAHSVAIMALTLLGFVGSLTPSSANAAVARGGFTTDSDEFHLLGTFGTERYYREDYVGGYTGDLCTEFCVEGVDGEVRDTNYIVVHADDSFESFANEVCTGCTLPDPRTGAPRTGNFTASYVLMGTGWDIENFTSTYTAYLWFTGGSGGLAGIRGGGVFHYDGSTGISSYSYRYRFTR